MNQGNSVVNWLFEGRVYTDKIELTQAIEQSELFSISRTESGNYMYRGKTYLSIEEVHERKMSDMQQSKPTLGHIVDRKHIFPASSWTFQGIRYPSFAAMLRAKTQTWAKKAQPNVQLTPPHGQYISPRIQQSIDEPDTNRFFPPIAKTAKLSDNGSPTDTPGPSTSTSGFRKLVSTQTPPKSQPTTTPKPTEPIVIDITEDDDDMDSGIATGRDIAFEDLPPAYQEAIELGDREIAEDDFNTPEFTHAEQKLQHDRYLRERAEIAAASAERRAQGHTQNPLYAELRERTDLNAKQKNRMRYRIKTQYFKSLGDAPTGEAGGATGQELLDTFKQWMAEKPGVRPRGTNLDSNDDSSAAIQEQLYIWDADV